MVRSHYIPQFILRNFCENDKITYCDICKREVSQRNTRSVFSERGYYSDETEKDLSKKIEHNFANLYHNKLKNAQYNIELTEEELFILKKYLIVSAVRYHFQYSEEDKKRIDSLGKAYKPNFEGNINEILSMNTIKEAYRCINKSDSQLGDLRNIPKINNSDEYNVPLWSEVKDIIQSYVIFVQASKEEEFIISDLGRDIWNGPIAHEKIFTLIDLILKGRIDLGPLATSITPRDYTIFPLSKRLAVISISSFYKLYSDIGGMYNVRLPKDFPTVSEALGFGNKEIISPPQNKFLKTGKIYQYEIKKLTVKDIAILNSVMINETMNYFAFSDPSHVKYTLEFSNKNTKYNLEFIQ